MQTPVFVSTSGSDLYINHREGMSKKKFHTMMNVPGVPESCVLWNGHEFEIGALIIQNQETPAIGDPWVFILQSYDDASDLESVIEISMHVYYPIDPRTNLDDWKRATSAYKNSTNDGWLPSHCDADHMLDREVEIRSAVIAAFAPGIQKLQQACLLQLALLAKNPSDSSAGSRELAARLKLDKLTEFQNKVLSHCETEARKRYLGWYHQNPDESHIHNIVHDAVTTLYHANSDDFALVQNEIMRSAFTVHAYETRWDQVARLKKEKEAADAAAAANQDQNQNQGDQE